MEVYVVMSGSDTYGFGVDSVWESKEKAEGRVEDINSSPGYATAYVEEAIYNSGD